ncbi:MAG TPA: hypothetical protein DEB40_02395 [Elusimicrobia bacterium]|nr:hypothetical protein [Elusimicrobiota bacterium]HBT60580.1 hypothetical protein [Elusimicrobiota bacterium]
MKKGTSAASWCAAMLITAALGGSAMPASAQSAMSDSWITAKIKMSMAADGRVKGRQVNVDTENGRVMLRGKVDTQEAKAAAEEITKGIENVKEVKNELQVVPLSRREAAEVKDEVITARVKKSFSKDRALRKADIGVMTNDGVVSLTGEVPDLPTSAKASWDAWKVSGVKSVKNDLTLKETTKGP